MRVAVSVLQPSWISVPLLSETWEVPMAVNRSPSLLSSMLSMILWTPANALLSRRKNWKEAA